METLLILSISMLAVSIVILFAGVYFFTLVTTQLDLIKKRVNDTLTPIITNINKGVVDLGEALDNNLRIQRDNFSVLATKQEVYHDSTVKHIDVVVESQRSKLERLEELSVGITGMVQNNRLLIITTHNILTEYVKLRELSYAAYAEGDDFSKCVVGDTVSDKLLGVGSFVKFYPGGLHFSATFNTSGGVVTKKYCTGGKDSLNEPPRVFLGMVNFNLV